MTIPGESEAYRNARNNLLVAEAELRAETERVAALRRKLPPGPPPKADYRFVCSRTGEDRDLEGLFSPGQDALFLYNLMYAPKQGQSACSMCVAMLDGLNGAAPHIRDRISIAVVAKASPAELRSIEAERNWRNLPLYSTSDGYNADYGAETQAGAQLPIGHIWVRQGGDIRYFWGTELFHHNEADWPHHPRHLDPIWPLWNALDLTPKGRGESWFPRLTYEAL